MHDGLGYRMHTEADGLCARFRRPERDAHMRTRGIMEGAARSEVLETRFHL